MTAAPALPIRPPWAARRAGGGPTAIPGRFCKPRACPSATAAWWRTATSISVEQGELRGVIGPNGAGKSTFFKMLTCEVHPTSGRSSSKGATSPG